MNSFLDTQQLIRNIENDIQFLKTHPNIFVTQHRHREVLETLQKTYEYLQSTLSVKESNNG